MSENQFISCRVSGSAVKESHVGSRALLSSEKSDYWQNAAFCKIYNRIVLDQLSRNMLILAIEHSDFDQTSWEGSSVSKQYVCDTVY